MRAVNAISIGSVTETVPFFFLALAQIVVDEGVLPLLVLCIQEPEVPLKRIAASCMGNIAKHNVELAQNVLAARSLPHFGTLLDDAVENKRDAVDSQLKRQICACIAHIVKHAERCSHETNI